jgi:hypothetical protein
LHWLSVLLAVALLTTAGCRRNRSYTVVDVSSLPKDLAPLPGARGAQAHTQPDGSIWIRYELLQAYPAEPTLKAIRERLESRGWVPLANDWLNPTDPSSHTMGWGFFIDGLRHPEPVVDQWMAQWRNANGDIILYEFRYESPGQSLPRNPDRPNNDKLRVTGMLAPAPLARRMMEWSAKKTPPSN